MMPLRDEDGTHLGYLKILRDRTEQRRAADALHRFAYVAEQSSDFVGIADPDGRVLFVNEAGRGMVGLEGEEAARRKRVLDFFLPEVCPSSRA